MLESVRAVWAVEGDASRAHRQVRYVGVRGARGGGLRSDRAEGTIQRVRFRFNISYGATVIECVFVDASVFQRRLNPVDGGRYPFLPCSNGAHVDLHDHTE